MMLRRWECNPNAPGWYPEQAVDSVNAQHYLELFSYPSSEWDVSWTAHIVATLYQNQCKIKLILLVDETGLNFVCF